MKRWKERLCIISIVFNWHSTSVSSTEFNTELNTICTVRDSTTRLAIRLYNSANNSADNSALQFVPTISSDEFVHTNGSKQSPGHHTVGRMFVPITSYPLAFLRLHLSVRRRRFCLSLRSSSCENPPSEFPPLHSSCLFLPSFHLPTNPL